MSTCIEAERAQRTTTQRTAGKAPREKERRPIALGVRDLAILGWMAEHRFSTKELLVDRFYSSSTRIRPGAKPSGSYGSQRIGQLEREGYLRRSRYRVHSTAPLLLSDLGYRLLHGRELALGYHPLADLDIESFEHDVWAQRLRIAFERDLGCSRWRTERSLKMAAGKAGLPYVPDARFYSPNGQAWNLEVERTPKRADRLKTLLGERAQASRKSAILYVLDRRFSEFYRDQMAITPNPGVFFITHFDDLSRVSGGANGWHPMPIKKVFGEVRS